MPTQYGDLFKRAIQSGVRPTQTAGLEIVGWVKRGEPADNPWAITQPTWCCVAWMMRQQLKKGPI